jgi:hypothetical protein
VPRNFTDKQLFNVLANLGLNGVNVASVGQLNLLLSAAAIPGGVPNYGSGFDVGDRIDMRATDFLSGSRYFVAATGTLFGGIYQLVKTDSTSLGANLALGKVAFLKNTTAGRQAFTVIDESVATANTEVAGIFLNTVTPGNFTFIQIAGDVNIQLKTGLSNGAPAEGDALFAGGGSGTIDDLTPGVTFNTVQLSRYLGVALAVPVSNTVILMHIKGILGIY